MKLADLGEHGFLEQLQRVVRRGAGVEVGIGDDAAVVRVDGKRWVLTTDALVEGVHFRRAWDRPEGLGRRAFTVNASDVAAMGARPRFALLSISLPARTSVAELEGVTRGFEQAARAAGCSLVGGNLTSSRDWTITATVIGEVEGRPLLRRGARPGDLLCVSGTLGGAAFGREALRAGRRVDPRTTRAFLRPVARVTLGRALARRRLATAAIDVSDGMLQDLGHLCRASRVGAVVEAARLPLAAPLRRLPQARALQLALGGGEDYELLFTMPAARERELTRLGVRVRRIGRIERGSGVTVVDAGGRRLDLRDAGFDHFTPRR